MKRAEILDTAKEIVTKDRTATHGAPENSFALIAEFWASYLGAKVNSTDVAIMMTLLKVARLAQNPDHADSWVDGAGYFACGGEIALATGNKST